MSVADLTEQAAKNSNGPAGRVVVSRGSDCTKVALSRGEGSLLDCALPTQPNEGANTGNLLINEDLHHTGFLNSPVIRVGLSQAAQPLNLDNLLGVDLTLAQFAADKQRALSNTSSQHHGRSRFRALQTLLPPERALPAALPVHSSLLQVEKQQELNHLYHTQNVGTLMVPRP